ncbi:serine hydrolase [Halobacterium sp. CBA1126]|uniref:serine hydrolase domain-containing protein n=1 Tax=Halobacterium sp. CBA1126 TaxID=2668074 RepID=UPI0012FCC0EF|nr:serine hydrolase domain-containing protein [Halobacterium sp. CBA1126]MUV59717.1 serine hydrolase [Halobacterium sp. CBA1126]
MPSTTTRRGFVAGVAAGSAALVGTGSAATARGSTRPRAGQSSLATVVSDALREAMAEYDADGATVGVVADGEPVLTEGVGHAYRNPDAPVDPEETLFRVGSVSKVPTFVAAMRLVDEGAVAPDDPVAPRLDSVTVPGGGEPITLAHLATHTSGFEQRYVGQVATSIEDVRPLPAVLEANHPARVNPPGELPLYTNYNAGLAGQFVADVHGTDFETAVADLVFDRLGMTDSTFDPLPAALVGGRDDAADDVSWYSGMAPASGLSATAADAVALLQALATDGATPAGRVLSPAATAALRDQWHTPHDALAGIAFGMKRQRRGDTLVVGHQGSVRDFRTDFRLVPDDGAGLFVSVHGADANDVQAAVTDAFLEAVAPVEAPETAGDGGLDAASAVTGEYKPVMATDAASHEKLLYHLLASETTLRTTADGRLETVRGGTTHRWTAVSPRVFRRSDGADALVVESRADGGRYAFYASDPWSPLEAVPWHGRSPSTDCSPRWPLSPSCPGRSAGRWPPAGVGSAAATRRHRRSPGVGGSRAARRRPCSRSQPSRCSASSTAGCTTRRPLSTCCSRCRRSPRWRQLPPPASRSARGTGASGRDLRASTPRSSSPGWASSACSAGTGTSSNCRSNGRSERERRPGGATSSRRVRPRHDRATIY